MNTNTQIIIDNIINAKKETYPWDYYLANNIFPDEYYEKLNGLYHNSGFDFINQDELYTQVLGKELADSKKKSRHSYVGHVSRRSAVDQFSYLIDLIDVFTDKQTIEHFCSCGNTEIYKDCYLRIQVIKDIGDFNLKIHTDAYNKIFTFMVFFPDDILNDNPDWGTYFYDKDVKLATISPYIKNHGHYFFPKEEITYKTLHGAPLVFLPKERYSLMINYIANEKVIENIGTKHNNIVWDIKDLVKVKI